MKLAERLEDELGDEHVSFIEGCPRDWGEQPIPDGPLTVGIDGGYVKAQGMEQGWFEVIAGKSILAFRRDEEQSASSSQCFAFVQTYDEKPKRRLFEHVASARDAGQPAHRVSLRWRRHGPRSAALSEPGSRAFARLVPCHNVDHHVERRRPKDCRNRRVSTCQRCEKTP